MGVTLGVTRSLDLSYGYPYMGCLNGCPIYDFISYGGGVNVGYVCGCVPYGGPLGGWDGCETFWDGS